MSENNITKALRVIIAPLQDIENALQQLLTERSVNNATGYTLDVIGKLVGQPRGGLVDDAYRRMVRARITANRSSGTVNEMLRVARLVLDDATATLVLTNHGNATQVLQIDDAAVAADVVTLLMRFVEDTQAGGVRTIVETSTVDPGTWFKWDTVGRGWDVAAFVDAHD